jgi:hypothetical protein
MPVTVRDLGGPPKGPPDLSLLFAGLFLLFILFLGARALIFGLASSSPTVATTAVATVAPQASIATMAELAPTVATMAELAPTATVTAPTPAPTAPGCPDAIALPEGAPVGWVGRAAGCPAVALANLGGAHRWVLRGDLSDDIFEQLPEIQP